MKITMPSWQDMDTVVDDLDPHIREAIEWMFRLEDEKITDEQRQAFREWLAADDRNTSAYQEAEKLWSAASMLNDKTTANNTVTRRNLLIGLAVGAITYPAWRLYSSSYADYETAKGELVTISLPDGTRVDMSSATSLSLEFTSEKRVVKLLAGEAFFIVSPDPTRPFVVKAGIGEAMALGTAYSVHLNNDQVHVTVAEHSVKVTHPAGEVQVDMGMMLEYNSEILGEVTPTDVQTALSWRQGRLVFVNEPLQHVLSELERWQKGKIVLVDTSLASRPVTAILDLNAKKDVIPQLVASVSARSFSATSYLTFIY